MKDHLGNTRVIFTEDGLDADNEPDILQEADYYPFGMRHQNATATNHYLYNGKELNTDLGLDWYDYGARWLDVETGRWSSIDPHAESYKSWTPYNYVYNNPLIYTDPTGKDAIITVTRNSTGKGGKINIAATVYVTGLNAKQKTKDLNAARATYFKSGKYQASDAPLDIYDITFNVEYKYLENASDYMPGEGNNLMTFVEEPERSHVSGGLVSEYRNTREAGYYNEHGEEWIMDVSKPGGRILPTGFTYQKAIRKLEGWTCGSNIVMGNEKHYSSIWGGIHETFHVLGLSDRYVVKGPYQVHEGFENDIMGMPGKKGIHETHYNNWGSYILSKGQSNFILKYCVDRTTSRELITNVKN